MSSSDSEEFAPQILGFSDEVNGQGPFTSLKSTRDASKLTESEGEKPKTQVTSSQKQQLNGEETSQHCYDMFKFTKENKKPLNSVENPVKDIFGDT